MDVEYLAGFFDGEGSFVAKIKPDTRYRLGSHIELIIDITQKDRKVLDLIKEFVGAGEVYFNSTYNLYQYRIYKIGNIFKFVSLVKDHLIVKRRDMELFSSCLNRILIKEHLTDNGFKEIKEQILLLHSRN